MELWPIRKTYGAEKLWQSYLVYRVKNERDPQIGRFVEIRQIAEQLCQRTEEVEYETVLSALCWLVLERGCCAPGFQEGWQAWNNREDKAPNPGLNLLSAAAYLGYTNLARQLLSYGHCPTTDNHIFPSPMQLVAWSGNADILRLFQEQLPEFEETLPRYRLDYQNWRGKTGPGSIKGATMRGDIHLVRLVVYPPSRANPENADFAGQPFGQVTHDPEFKPGYDLQDALFCAKNWEVFQYINSFFKESILLSKSSCAVLLARYAELGNLEMVRQLLNVGADIHGEGTNLNPLTPASRFCHEDVVDLLLERGADPNYDILQARGSSLMAATAGGSLTIVRKLLENSPNVGNSGHHLPDNAVHLEHTAMVELLEFQDWGDSARQQVLNKARENGLDSMVSLLQKTTPRAV